MPMLTSKGLEGFHLTSWPSASAERSPLQAEFARLADAERDASVSDRRTGKCRSRGYSRTVISPTCAGTFR